MIAVLAPVYGAAMAVALAVIIRICNVMADGLAFLVGLWMRRAIDGGHGVPSPDPTV